MKKNCHTCEHLEWVDGECFTGSGSGYVCNKRHDDMTWKGKEDEFLAMLDREEYRNKGKRCHDPKFL